MKILLRRRDRESVRPSLTFCKRRKPKLDTALYMRPIRASRIGHINTKWATDGWHRQGVPVNKSLILVLKCGHIEIVPQHPSKLRKLVRCPMCVRLWTERSEQERISKLSQRKRKRQNQEIEVMAKKSLKKKKVTTSSDSDRRGRKVFEFVKVPKADLEGKGIMKAVFDGIKKIKSGTSAEISEAAIKAGLKDHTGQDPLTQTIVMLNRLRAMGAVAKVESEAKAKGKAAKAVAVKKKALKFKLKKAS